MINYITGDLLKSPVEALVNTVNCEGYMGKGIAYQFKLQYPENNISYIKACKNKELTVGKLHHYYESGKLIINFPTKDKWRKKSKMSYINDGLDELVLLINLLDVKSIAIPPLGSGNGGLIWSEVKELIKTKLSVISEEVKINVHEPSRNYSSKAVAEPKLSTSALILMRIKNELEQFDSIRLQKTAYFVDVLSGQNYFKFTRNKFGPYDNSISIISKNIKEYQKFHNVINTNEAYKILYTKLISNSVNTTLESLVPYVIKSAKFVNSIKTNHALECMATIVYLINEEKVLTEVEVVREFKCWSEDKDKRFSKKCILDSLNYLHEKEVVTKTLLGYIIQN